MTITFLVWGSIVLASLVAWSLYVIIGGSGSAAQAGKNPSKDPKPSLLKRSVSGLGPIARVLLVGAALVIVVGAIAPYMRKPMQAPTSLYPMSDKLERGELSERLFVPPLERYPLFFELRHTELRNSKGEKVKISLQDLDIRIQGYQPKGVGLEEDGPMWKWQPGMTLHRHKYFRYMLGENAKVRELPKGVLWIVRDETREE